MQQSNRTPTGRVCDHPRFLEWIGAPESARLLDKGPNAWMQSLSREQAIEATRQLHRDACLTTSNLNILDQYVLCLQSTAATILEHSLGARAFPSAAVASVPRFRFIWKAWASGALRLIQLCGREMDWFAA